MSDVTPAPFPTGTILGYPRIGANRELKKALESFWKGATTEADLEAIALELRTVTRDRLAGLGLGATTSAIPSNFSFYDHMLDAAVTFGAIPSRFADLRGNDGSVSLAAYSTIARGVGDKAPLEMTKWFDSNYHYLVPEIGPETVFALSSARWVDEFLEAKAAGFITRPVITGPVTFLYLAKASDEAKAGFEPISRLDDLLPVYAELLAVLKAAGADWVQIDEPILVADTDANRAEVLANAARVYQWLGEQTARPSCSSRRPWARSATPCRCLVATPVEAIGLDLVRGAVPVGLHLTGKVIAAGVVDGHNIWRTDLDAALATLKTVAGAGRHGRRVHLHLAVPRAPHPPGRGPPGRGACQLARLRRREGRRDRRPRHRAHRG